MTVTTQIDNVNIKAAQKLIAPSELKESIVLPEAMASFIQQSRTTISNILKGDDQRLMVIVGPCSIHNPEEALDYAKRLAELNNKVSDTLFLVMRVYFEKPRTTIGWKGLVNDPFLNGSFRIEEGLSIARKLMRDITALGLPIATEALDPIIPQYLHDFVSWTAIGARTTESQTHREMSSGLSSPVGFKNGTDGDLSVAVNAMKSASSGHSFLGVDLEGKISVIETKGNNSTHIVLRGGHKPNYDSVSVAECEDLLRNSGFTPSIVIDCSHGNSLKDHKRQPLVVNNVISQVMEGNNAIKGLMLESNMVEGNQSLPTDISLLNKGQSITDKCIDWRTTETLLLDSHQKLKYTIQDRSSLSLEIA
jgi:3-deoxy-7-phosphoheptulonate synthase